MISTSITSADAIAPGSPAAIPCLLIASAVLAVGDVVALEPGVDLGASIGRGKAADELAFLFRQGLAQALVACAAGASSIGVWSPAPAVTHTGSGPAITCALAAGVPGCLDDHPLLARVVSPGGLGVATMEISYDGTTVSETILVPEEHPATLRGSTDISEGADLEGLTLAFTAPASKTLTFGAGSQAAAGAGLHAALATQAADQTVLKAALVAGGLAELAAHPRRLSWTTGGGTPTHGPTSADVVGFDPAGAAQTETVTLTAGAGTYLSTKFWGDVTSYTLKGAGGTDATVAFGYGSRFADAAEIVAAANALAVAAPLLAVARAAQDAAGTYLELVTDAVGASATETVDAASTADAVLGLSNVAAHGAAATYTLPASGLVLTFPSGDYDGDTYAISCVGPRITAAGAVAAATAAHDQYPEHSFGFCAVVQPASSAANASAMLTALDALRAAWLADTSSPRDILFAVGGTWHAAAALKATNDAAIKAADQATIAAFASAVANPGSIVAGDVYVPGDPAQAAGIFRRSAALCYVLQRAQPGQRGEGARLAATVAEGYVPGVTLTGPDGVTKARNESTASVKLGKLDGPGFFVLKTASDGRTVRFELGATRAGKTSRLRHDGDVAVAYESARLIQTAVEPWLGQRPEIDQSTKMLADHERASRGGAVDAALRPFLRPEPPSIGLPNVSDFAVQVLDPPAGATYVDTGITPVKATLGVLGTITDVQITVGLAGTTIGAPAGQ